ncbi:protein kinase [Nocardioides sp. JQ2195]|uniref:serine/threonine-protein kinase n=1 Tax=Nocardioides sp. JQ2195 TaxID=2592334 RepID=UPI00143E8415|nr:serine/threonine-protein kinase [Nocardioides sp. JQ2195]QIX25415.1 protein kinase [Nocardioides sp. JQ2195]
MSLNTPAPGTRFGRYRIDERIGMGGMGVVFRATDTHLNRTVALKVMAGRLTGDDAFTQRFEREADIMARLDSPHVIAILDHGVEDGVPWIATQFVRGGDLSDLLRETGSLSLTRAANVSAQIAEALSDAHRAGVVHRDVKPSNVLLRESPLDSSGSEPFAYLCDFGIAHAGSTGLTQTGGVAGSWAWLAPERTKGDPGTARSDIYALGCVLWATLTGHAPYAGSDVEVALAQVRDPVPQFIGDDPATTRVNAVLAKALAKDPADRYPTAAEFRVDLLSLTRLGDRALVAPEGPTHAPDGTGTAVRDGSRSGTSRQRPGAPRWPVAALLALALVAGASYAVWRQQGDDQPPGQEPAAIQGDVDGDGRGDLVFRWFNWGSKYKEGRNFLVRSTGTSFAEPRRTSQPDGYMVRGDVDGDGHDDVVAIDDNLETKGLDVTVISSDGTQSGVAFGRRGHRDDAFPVMADVNGDGLDDLLLTWARRPDDARSTLELELAVATDNGFAQPTPAGTIAGWAGYGEVMVAGDVDGDRRDDLVLRRTHAGEDGPEAELRVLRSDGSGFAPASAGQATPFDGPVPPPVDVADLDGDGTEEVVVLVRDVPGILRVHRFEDDALSEGEDWATDPVGDPEGTAALALVDVDGDGKSDAVLQRSNTETHVRLDVALSTGESFRAPSRWAEVACLNKECDETWSIVTDNIT